jgi:hypothetical protein
MTTKLNEGKVRAIRQRAARRAAASVDGAFRRALATEFGVSPLTIDRVISGCCWQHVQTWPAVADPVRTLLAPPMRVTSRELFWISRIEDLSRDQLEYVVKFMWGYAREVAENAITDAAIRPS